MPAPASGSEGQSNSSVFMCCAVNASSLIRDLITHNGSHLNLLSEGILIEHWQTSSEQMGTGNAKSCVCTRARVRLLCVREMLSMHVTAVWSWTLHTRDTSTHGRWQAACDPLRGSQRDNVCYPYVACLQPGSQGYKDIFYTYICFDLFSFAVVELTRLSK